MRVVGYCRVSTDRQAEEGYGLVAQERAIREWSKANGHELVRVHSEAASGMLDHGRRAALVAAYGDVLSHRVDGVVVALLDRVGRTLHVQEAWLSAVWQAEGQVFAVDTGEICPDDASDPYHTFVRQVLGAAAQLERVAMLARMRAGRAAKAADGGYAYRRPPYGYRAEGRALVLDPDEQAAITRALSLRAAGASLRDVCTALDSEGYLPRSGS